MTNPMTDTQAGLLPEPSVRNLTDAELANMLGIIATILETAIGIQKSVKTGSAEYVREAAARLTSSSPPASAEVAALANRLENIGLRTKGKTLAVPVSLALDIIQALRGQASGAAVQVPEDYITHHNDWVAACTIARDNADCASDRAYWQHQLDTLERLAAAPQGV